MTAEALNAADITEVGVVLIVALVLIGALLSIVVTALVGRLVLVALVVLAAVFVWQQRTHVENSVNSRACRLDTTFFGVHLDVPQSVRSSCTRS